MYYRVIVYKTKVTRKGQITLPIDYREKLDIGAGSVVALDVRGQHILVSKPKAKQNELFGSWSELTDGDVKRIRDVWRGWNEKNIRRF